MKMLGRILLVEIVLPKFKIVFNAIIIQKLSHVHNVREIFIYLKILHNAK